MSSNNGVATTMLVGYVCGHVGSLDSDKVEQLNRDGHVAGFAIGNKGFPKGTPIVKRKCCPSCELETKLQDPDFVRKNGYLGYPRANRISMPRSA